MPKQTSVHLNCNLVQAISFLQRHLCTGVMGKHTLLMNQLLTAAVPSTAVLRSRCDKHLAMCPTYGPCLLQIAIHEAKVMPVVPLMQSAKCSLQIA